MSATILVVEDDAAIAESVRDVLVAAGYQVPEMAASGARALELAERLRPALVLMDVQIEGPSDGIDTAMLLRERTGIRVVYLTGLSDDDTLRRAKATAPLGYLKKPFNARELRIAVELALHQAGLESALAAREKWFASTLQSIGDAVVTTDSDDRVTFVNPAAEATIGVRATDVLGTKVHDVVRLVDKRGSAGILSIRFSVRPARTTALPPDARLLTASGNVEIEGTVAPIALDAGPALGSVMVFRNVAERRQLERRVGMAERLAAIGTMAAGMQHEINNPLATVVANVQYTLDVLRAKPEGPSQGEIAELISALVDASEGAERVRRTVEDLRHFSRAPETDDAPLDITSAMEEAARITAHAVRHHATIRREYGEVPLVRAEEGQLARVFMNLLLNAAQATGDGDAASHTIVLRTRTDDAGRAVAEVSDDGAGISGDVLERIFHPFVTTGAASAQSGLGLAVCHNIVTSLGGDIDVESVLGKGTTFRVTLPAAGKTSIESDSCAPPKLPPPVSDRPEASRARVLVVDDEDAIGRAIHRILMPDHDVVLENDPRAALVRLETERYDVVFCDLMMPQMSGMDFFDALETRAPDVSRRVVFLTGGAFSPRSEEFLRTSRNVCLSKPFSREDISSIVRRVMTGA